MKYESMISLYDSLSPFQQKILDALAERVGGDDDKALSYCIPIKAFNLDLLNPSDIRERLEDLTLQTIEINLDGRPARLPIVTHISYSDLDKTFTCTFNSYLKDQYLALKQSLNR